MPNYLGDEKLAGKHFLFSVASSSRDPSLKYEFIPAAAKDKGPIMDVALNHFLYTEPHSVVRILEEIFSPYLLILFD